MIVGGESGPGFRPIDSEWVMAVRDQCLSAGVSFFFKQWGGVHKTKAGRTLDGPDLRRSIPTGAAESRWITSEENGCWPAAKNRRNGR